MTLKSKLKTFGETKMQNTICVDCFNNYQRHQPTIHHTCFFLLQDAGALDVKGPKKIKDRNAETEK